MPRNLEMEIKTLVAPSLKSWELIYATDRLKIKDVSYNVSISKWMKWLIALYKNIDSSSYWKHKFKCDDIS